VKIIKDLSKAIVFSKSLIINIQIRAEEFSKRVVKSTQFRTWIAVYQKFSR